MKHFAVQLNLDAYIVLDIDAQSAEEAETIARRKLAGMSTSDIAKRVGDLHLVEQVFVEEDPRNRN